MFFTFDFVIMVPWKIPPQEQKGPDVFITWGLVFGVED